MNLKNFPKRLDSKTSCLRVTVPENLDLALEGLIRKVLKEQPKTDDIYSFAADYFETLLRIRDMAGAKFTAAQLCPFHNDEDAHEMIKLAGTFSKPRAEKRGERSLTPKAKKNEDGSKVRAKKNVGRPKSKESLKSGKNVEQNKQARCDLIQKIPIGVKPEEEKIEEVKPESKSSEIKVEQELKKEESEDEEFLASDPIKELVEKELMEKKEVDVKRSESPEGALTNEKNQEDHNLVDANQKPAINDSNRAVDSEEVNKIQSEEIKNEKEFKIESEKDEELVKEKPTVNEGVDKGSDNKRIDDVDKENKKDEEKPNEVKSEDVETQKEAAPNVEDTKKDNIMILEETITAEKKEIPDESLELMKPAEQLLTRGNQTKEEKENKEREINDEANMKEEKDKIEAVSTSENEEHPKDDKKKGRDGLIGIEKLNENNTNNVNPPTKGEENNVETLAKGAENEIKSENPKEIETRVESQVHAENKATAEEITEKEEGFEEKVEKKEDKATVDEIKPSNKQSGDEITEKKERSEEKVERKEDKATVEEIKPNNKQSGEEITEKEEGFEEKVEKKEDKATVEEIKPSNKQSGEEITEKEEGFEEKVEKKEDKATVEEIKPSNKQSGDEITEKKERSEEKVERKQDKATVEEIKPNNKQSGDDDVEETNNDQKQLINDEKVDDNEVESTERFEKDDAKNPKEELGDTIDTLQTEQQKDHQEIDETETTQEKPPKNKEKSSYVDQPIKGMNNENMNAKEESAEKSQGGIKIDEVILTPTETIKPHESVPETKAEPDAASNRGTNDKLLEEGPKELSSETENLNIQYDDATNQNKIDVVEKVEKETKNEQVKANEDDKIGKETKEEEDTVNIKGVREENSQGNEMAVAPQGEVDKTAEDNPTVLQNPECHSATEKENIGQEEAAELCTVVDIQNISGIDEEKTNEKLKPNKLDGQKKDKESEPEDALIDNQEMQRTEECEKKSEEPDFKSEVEDVKNNTDEEQTKLFTETNGQSVPEENKDSEKSNEELKREPEDEAERSQNKEDNPNMEEELCVVVDAEHIPKMPATDLHKLEKESEAEVEGKEEPKAEEPVGIVSPNIITSEGVERAKENEEKLQTPGEVQIKTIQTHYYDTLQVPEAEVTKEYRVHSVANAPMNAVVGVISSLQPNNEPINTKNEETNVNLPSTLPTGLVDTVDNTSPPAGFTDAEVPQTTNLDSLQEIDELKNLKTLTPTFLNIASQTELESETQKSDSDDLLDLTTPTSGYSLNLSELSLQTVSGLFLDSEKRYSSLEKEDIRFATPNTNKPTTESDELKNTESRQEVEEIIQKTVVSPRIGAVPVPPREEEEINEESNVETTENLKEKKEDKPEHESSESSTNSSNGQSLEVNTPVISVEVKTVIETQILDDEEEEDEEHNKDEGRPDLEIKVEATIEIPDEERTTQPEPPEEKKEISDANSQEQNNLKSTEIQDKSQQDKQNEISLTVQSSEKEGSSGESDSTISSAVTEIKRQDSARRTFSSTRSLLSTQSLDFGKKNPLMKTRSLSTFRHGVTDFEVWNTIEKELEEAATKIQSNFRGYKTRKKLQRENAVQITTEESSISTTPVEPEIKAECQQSTGEFHDGVVLSEHPR